MNALTQHPLPAARPVSGPQQFPQENTPIHDAAALTGGGRLARIHLDGQVYALRITRQGKLTFCRKSLGCRKRPSVGHGYAASAANC
jgi:hemin uptake protein HemP